MSDLVARSIGPSDAEALASLFDAAGSDCLCRYWHFEGDKNAWLARCAFERDVNRQELISAVARENDEGTGVVAFVGDRLVAWAKVAPSRALTKLYHERYYRNLVSAERPAVWTIGCFLVHPAHRRRGVAIEAFPRRVEAEVADEELWRGPEGALTACGFTVSAGDPAYPVMCLRL